MSDITPDMVALVANKLYRQDLGVAVPDPAQAGQVPPAQFPSQAAQQAPSGFPGQNALPSHLSAPPQQLPDALPNFAGFEPGTHATTPEHHAGPRHADHTSYQPAAAASTSQASSGSSTRYSSAQHAPTYGAGSQHPSSYLTPQHEVGPSNAGQYDGLRAFVQSIRANPLNNRSGHSGLATPSDGDPSLGYVQRAMLNAAAATQQHRPFDVQAIRRDFPVLNQRVHGHPLAWFDNAATTQKPQCVIDAVSQFYAHDNSNIHRAAHSLAARATDAYEGARSKIQKFLGASSNKEIVYVRGTTEGINLCANIFGRKFLHPGDEILLSQLEHHANIVPWQMIARERGATIRVIPVNDRGEIMLEQYQALLNPRVKMVALTQASNSLGTLLPVGEMTQMAKRYGAYVLIDGAQSVSHVPVNVNELGCDFFVFSGHKLFAPTGIGAVYIRQSLHELLPAWQGGGNMIKNVTFEETTYADAPAKFEAGTPSIADAVGLGAAIDYVTRLGLPNIAKYEHQLLHYATDKLASIPGLRMFGHAREKVSVISFVLPHRKTEEVGKLLDLQGIAVRSGHHCSQPSLRRFGLETSVRPSFTFYNTCEEIDRLVEAVRRINLGA